jgi:hypothetical protein
MNRRWITVLAAAFAIAGARATALAQRQGAGPPHAGYAYPAGGQRGTTVRITVGGESLTGVAGAMVSGAGVRAKVVDYDRPVAGQALNALRDTVQALQRQLQGRGGNPALRQRVAELRARIADSQRRSANPAIAELVTVEVSIAADAEVGARRLRLQTPAGLTNPIVFRVDQFPELRESDVKQIDPDMSVAITLPAVVNGQLIPGEPLGGRGTGPQRGGLQYRAGDIDRYRFVARKGEHLVAVVSARDLIPYLADAVPGWIQPTLTLLDAGGREIAYADDHRFHPDPVIHHEIPADGEYLIEIKDALYRGREDFVYRLTIGALPFVTSVFPLGGRAGSKADVSLTGWNLPSTTLQMDAKKKGAGVYPVTVGGDGGFERLHFAVDTLPETFENEPNDTPSRARAITVPMVVNGRIDQPGDWDVFSFKLREGETLVAEIVARRLGSPIDAMLDVIDASGKRIAVADDCDDPAAGLETHHADPWLSVRAPTTGTFHIRVSDVQQKGGGEYGYRLRVSAPRPDYELRVSPSAINLSAGVTVPVSVRAIRRDGFDGDIAVTLRDAPRGLVLSGAVVPAGQNEVRMTITAPAPQLGGRGNARSAPVAFALEGRASIQGRTVARRAIPADDMMQAFAYHHLVSAEDLRLTVGARGAVRGSPRVLTPQPVRVAAGGDAEVRVAIPPAFGQFANLQFQLNGPPDGVAVKDVSIGQLEASFRIVADSAKVRRGLRTNLIIQITGERAAPAGAAAPQRRQRVTLGTIPAIAIEISR